MRVSEFLERKMKEESHKAAEAIRKDGAPYATFADRTEDLKMYHRAIQIVQEYEEKEKCQGK